MREDKNMGIMITLKKPTLERGRQVGGGAAAWSLAVAWSLPTQFPPPTSPRWGEAMAMRDSLFKKSPRIIEGHGL
jgi:hypothetical protein